jgi:hypothetical protein
MFANGGAAVATNGRVSRDWAGGRDAKCQSGEQSHLWPTSLFKRRQHEGDGRNTLARVENFHFNSLKT